MKFQVYASNTLANMESPTYTGPDGTSGTYYSTPTGESFHSSVVGRYFRCQAFLSSDSGQTTTPDFSGLRVTYAGGSGANAWSETVNTFDSRGNMTRREKTYWNGSATVTDTDVRDDASWSAGDRINNLNQVKKRIVTPAGGSATTWTFSYDANGRMTSKTDGTNTWTYTWDPDEPRLTRVQGPGGVDVSYSYDSAGRMLTRTSGGVTTTFEWDGWTMVKETTGSVVTRYIAPQGQIHSFERGGQVYQVHSDAHNGSVRAITDASGTVVAHYEFDAWGNQLGSSSPFSGGFAYGCLMGALGVRYDATSGLHYCRNRWLDVTLGRFLSRDSSTRHVGENLYLYCEGGPVNRIDISGNQWFPTGRSIQQALQYGLERLMSPIPGEAQELAAAAITKGGLELLDKMGVDVKYDPNLKATAREDFDIPTGRLKQLTFKPGLSNRTMAGTLVNEFWSVISRPTYAKDLCEFNDAYQQTKGKVGHQFRRLAEQKKNPARQQFQEELGSFRAQWLLSVFIPDPYPSALTTNRWMYAGELEDRMKAPGSPYAPIDAAANMMDFMIEDPSLLDF